MGIQNRMAKLAKCDMGVEHCDNDNIATFVVHEKKSQFHLQTKMFLNNGKMR